VTDFIYRTEDLPQDQVSTLFVDTPDDRRLVDALKGRQPTIIVGSRGVGKSLLLRVAEAELLAKFAEDRVLPVYVSFSKSALINTSHKDQFVQWMLARICSRLVRCLKKNGLVVAPSPELSLLSGGGNQYLQGDAPPIERVLSAFEESWKRPNINVDAAPIPDVDSMKDAVDDLCESLDIERLVFLFDEAAHVFRPEQQRQFFTVFRDLRCARITCNAAVYPGTTSYGDSFQPVQDATLLSVERNVTDKDYVDRMKLIVERQADSTLSTAIQRNAENFGVLAYAAHGNPRILLKTVSRAKKLTSRDVNDVIRDYFRNDIWAEHSALASKYSGHKHLVDWGRKFVEDKVLVELTKRNERLDSDDGKTTCYFWIHRDAPAAVHEAIRLLAYSGVVIRHGEGIKATMGQIGDRYAVCLGCVFSLQSSPTTVGLWIAKGLSPVKGLIVYGQSNPNYQELVETFEKNFEPDTASALAEQLRRKIDVLDLPSWLRKNLKDAGFQTISDILNATDDQIRSTYYVGKVRSKKVKSAATNAVLEYLSG